MKYKEVYTKRRTCGRCKGSGFVDYQQVATPSGTMNYRRECTRCNGTGRISWTIDAAKERARRKGKVQA